MRSAVTLLCVLAVCTVPAVGAASTSQVSQPIQPSADAGPAQVQDGEMFERVDGENSALVIQLDVSLLTSLFEPGSTFRIVTGGTAGGQRVVWFDIGIGYRGGPVLTSPTDGFVVHSEMSMNFPA